MNVGLCAQEAPTNGLIANCLSPAMSTTMTHWGQVGFAMMRADQPQWAQEFDLGDSAESA